MAAPPPPNRLLSTGTSAIALTCCALTLACSGRRHHTSTHGAEPGPSSGLQSDRADLVIVGGTIVTVDPQQPTAEALAAKGDRIVAVGARADIERLVGDDTRVIDLDGQIAVPGLIDSHMHFARLGTRLRTVFLDEAKSPAEVASIVAQQVAQTKRGEWITGRGWHTVAFGSDAYPDHTQLTRVAPDHPVYLSGMANHAAWVNAAALRIAGITKDTPDPKDGKILRDASGQPTGVLLEGAKELVSRYLPEPSKETRKQDLLKSVETALRLGLTAVHDAGSSDDDIALYKELLAEGELRVRLYAMRYVPDGGEELDRALATPPEKGLGGGYLSIRSIKAYADGALGARGAMLLSPYSDRPNERGMAANSPDELYRILDKATRAGYQVGFHAIGDAGNRAVLDAIARVERAFPDRDLRPRIEHAQVLAPEDLPRFAELGVIAAMQPIHATMDMGFAEARLGPERIRGAYAWNSLLKSGARVAASADTPAFPVAYSNPLWGIHAAVTRQDRQGQPAGGFQPQERVSRLEALQMYTVHGAYAGFADDRKGMLREGMLCDVTVLSRDIRTIPAAEILATKATMTIVGGKVEFDAASPR